MRPILLTFLILSTSMAMAGEIDLNVVENKMTQIEKDLGLQIPQDPPEKTDLSSDEILKLLRQIQATGSIGADQISIETLRDPRDIEATQKLTDDLSTAIALTMADLRSLKKAVIRYSVIVTQSGIAGEMDKLRSLTKSYSEVMQDYYGKSLGHLVDVLSNQDKVAFKCRSEICVVEIDKAYRDLLNFVISINKDLDFQNMNESTQVFWNFNHPILKNGFAKTFRNMIAPNQDHNAHKVLAAGLFTPLSVVGVTTFNLIRTATQGLFNPRVALVGLDVRKVSEIDRVDMQRALDNSFRRNIRRTATESLSTEVLPPKDVRSCSGYVQKYFYRGEWTVNSITGYYNLADGDALPYGFHRICEQALERMARAMYPNDKNGSPERHIYSKF